MQENFSPLSNPDSYQSSKQRTHRKNVIKSSQIILKKEPVIISTVGENQVGSLQPIMENGIIIGAKYRCQCGREVEIHFDY